ncbi:DUF1491 family protein [Stappia sp. ES.058]|uniref:DUF1491 family protein n=1 Tax=Stappia sp. ES.058 TaxID=1881061 RepID=UPI00087BC0EA|nr:DUF1491 family protein [Stappia sp. ES.058]SDT98581.1 hypothetical protein SAMN05428979_0923 [Stappia sp. ES.058]
MRLTSDFFVSALVRRCFSENAYASIVSKGALEAGAIYIVVDRRDGCFDLYGPAPQSAFEGATPGSRLFEVLLTFADKDDVDRRLASERRMDPDVWIVEIEDREGRVFWDVVET